MTEFGLPGEQAATARLSRTEVLEIRRRYTGARGELVMLAADYGVSKSAIWRIVHRKNWSRHDQEWIQLSHSG